MRLSPAQQQAAIGAGENPPNRKSLDNFRKFHAWSKARSNDRSTEPSSSNSSSGLDQQA